MIHWFWNPSGFENQYDSYFNFPPLSIASHPLLLMVFRICTKLWPLENIGYGNPDSFLPVP